MDNLVIKKVKSKSDLNKEIKIRNEVFIKEQRVPINLEIDGLDNESEHFLAFLNNKPIGCARIRYNKNYAKLERIAILKIFRKKGFGKKLTQFLIDYCKEKNVSKIYIHSQLYVSDFYKKFDFKTIGNIFFEAGIEHVKMQKIFR